MRLAALVLVTGCWNATQTAPVGPVANGPVIIVDAPGGVTGGASSGSSRAHRHDKFPLHSVWEGTYICNQGLSSVTLTIDATRNGTATARYDFGPTPSNPAVPNGAYTMKGALEATGAGGFGGTFEPDEWINHPANYFMVGLKIETGDGKTMIGTISHGSCSAFKTTRIN